jgi:hypothetical protein
MADTDEPRVSNAAAIDFAGWALRLFNEMEAETERGCALIGAAELDSLLIKVLQRRLVGGRQNVKWFESGGPLDSFSARIEMAYAVGLIGPTIRRHLNTVRKIRNEFAHKRDVRTFDEHARVKDWCATLCRWPRPAPVATSHRRYSDAVACLVLCVVEAHHGRHKLQEPGDIDPESYLAALTNDDIAATVQLFNEWNREGLAVGVDSAL